MSVIRFGILIRCLAVGVCLVPVVGSGLGGQQWDPLVQRLQRDGFEPSVLRSLFEQEDLQFDPEPMRRKMKALFEAKFRTGQIRKVQEGLQKLGFDPGPVDGLEGPRTRSAVIRFQKKHGLRVTGRATAQTLQSIEETLYPERPPRPKPEPRSRVYETILVPERLAEAVDFRSSQSALLAEIEEKYGIPPEIVVGILTVESRVGQYLGSRKAFTTLASMALCADFGRVTPFFADETLTRERKSWLRSRSQRTAEWAYRELKALLEYSSRNALDPVSFVGSVYGAIGISQFMPSSAIHYGVDGDHDGVVNLFEMADALHSLANYVREHGWRGRVQGRRTQERILYRYNRSRTYVNTVLAVAEHLRNRHTSHAVEE